MAGPERDKSKKRSSHRRRHTATTDEIHNDDGQAGKEEDIYAPPKDASALREARLKSMSKDPSTRNRMKVEYMHERPARAKSVSFAEKRISKRSNSIFGRASVFKEPTPVKKSKPVEVDEVAELEQYVYGRPGVDRRDFQKEHDRVQREARRSSKTTKKAPVTPTGAQESMSRSQTTPPPPKARTSSQGSATRPHVRRTSMVVTSNRRRSLTDSPPLRAASVTTSTTANKKKSGVFSLFSQPVVPEKMVSCLTCGSDDVKVSQSAKLPCTHRMCHACLKRIFKMSVKDPAHMPPRCCTEEHIDLKHVDKLFNQDFKKLWNRKFKEYTAKNRVYCPRRGCGEWIQSKHMYKEQGRKVGKCPKCKFVVCTMCNQKAHRARECPKDPEAAQFTEVAKAEGWKKCYNCSATVELKEGCNHMTCRCTAEFCMCCGLKWKTCDCPWFNYSAVEDIQDNPVRYQQEIDRRREQERQDEAFARRLQGMNVDDAANARRAYLAERNGEEPDLELGNAAGHHMNQNFVQQAREALATNYQNAEVAARGLLAGWWTGRENPVPAGIPGDMQQQMQQLRQPVMAVNNVQQNSDTLANPGRRRTTYRVRHADPAATAVADREARRAAASGHAAARHARRGTGQWA